MQQEAADEFLRRQSHLSLFATVRVIFPAKSDLPVLHADQPVVGDGHPMRVAGQIVQYMFGPAEGLSDVNYPLMRMQGVQESCKGARLGKPRQRAMEREFLLAEETFQGVAEFAAEDYAQYFLRQKEAGTLGPNPAVAAGREAAGRHDAVDVRMVAPALTIP